MSTIRNWSWPALKPKKHADCLSRVNILSNWGSLKPYIHRQDVYKTWWKTYIIIDIKNKKIIYAGISKNPQSRIKRHWSQMSTDTINQTRIRPSTNHLNAYLLTNQINWAEDVKMVVLKRFKHKQAAKLAEAELINVIQMNFQLSKWGWNNG